MSPERELVLVSNRGPATFERAEDGSLAPRRGGGGRRLAAGAQLARERDPIVANGPQSVELAERRAHRGPSRRQSLRRRLVQLAEEFIVDGEEA